MAVAYTEFTCLAQDLLANIQTAILASSDWARPNAAGKPNLYKATTTRGAQMVVDFSDAAQTVQALTLGVYRTHDGTTGVDKINRYLYSKAVNGGTLATNYVRGTVSVGKEHLFITTEGPRGSEANADNVVFGSMKSYFFLCDVVPYFDASVDPVPAVVCGGWLTANPGGDRSVGSQVTQVSRTHDNQNSWSQGKLASLGFPMSNWSDTFTMNQTGPDGQTYLLPYVFFDDNKGIRGRLNNLFFAGFNASATPDAPSPAVGSIQTYNGQKYRLIAAHRSYGANFSAWGSLGAVLQNNADLYTRSVVVAVPYV